MVALVLSLLPVSFPIAAHAGAHVPRLGLLIPGSPSIYASRIEAFRHGLRELGYVEGRNIDIEYRYAEARVSRLPALAQELVRLAVDAIVVDGTASSKAAQSATATIPIVMAFMGDPVGAGLVASLARPGGNITGMSFMLPAVSGKRLEILKGTLPSLSRVTVLWNPEVHDSVVSFKETQAAALVLGLQLQSLEVRSPAGFDKAFSEITDAQALVVISNAQFYDHRARLAALTIRSRIPAIFHLREYVEAGGLMAYGARAEDLYRRAATYADKILKGATPADLPVEQPTKFDLVINRKTAQTLGIRLRPSLLIKADHVVQ